LIGNLNGFLVKYSNIHCMTTIDNRAFRAADRRLTGKFLRIFESKHESQEMALLKIGSKAIELTNSA
jgi:hypothetical protein